jgi:hypothetical protein
MEKHLNWWYDHPEGSTIPEVDGPTRMMLKPCRPSIFLSLESSNHENPKCVLTFPSESD